MNAARWLLLSALCLGLVHLLILPPWMGEDEPWQFDYVENVARGHRPLAAWELGPMWKKERLGEHPAGVLWATYQLADLTPEEAYATQAEIVGSMRAEHFGERVDHDPRAAEPRTWDEFQGRGGHYHAYAQPGLYYLLVGNLLKVGAGWEIRSRLYLARAFSLLCYLGVVWIAIALTRLATSDRRTIFLAGLLAAWWPMHVRQAAVVNNDVLVKTFVGLTILCSARFALRDAGWRHLALAGLFLLAGLATKTTAVGAVGVIGLALLFARRVSPRVRWIAFGGVLALLAVAAVSWFAINNNAIPHTLERFVQRVSQGASPQKLEHLLVTAVGTTNWESRWLPSAFYPALGIFVSVGAALALVRLTRRTDELQRRAILFCLGTVGAQIGLIVLHGEAHGRYLFPMIPAIAALLAVGYTAFEARLRTVPFVVAAAVVLLFETWFLWGELVPNHYLIWGA